MTVQLQTTAGPRPDGMSGREPAMRLRHAVCRCVTGWDWKLL